MVSMPQVLTTKRFVHGGREYASGVSVEMTPTDALVHARKGNVTLSKQPTPTGAALQPTAQTAALQPAVRAKRAYRRRDMVAETATVESSPPPTTEPA